MEAAERLSSSWKFRGPGSSRWLRDSRYPVPCPSGSQDCHQPPGCAAPSGRESSSRSHQQGRVATHLALRLSKLPKAGLPPQFPLPYAQAQSPSASSAVCRGLRACPLLQVGGWPHTFCPRAGHPQYRVSRSSLTTNPITHSLAQHKDHISQPPLQLCVATQVLAKEIYTDIEGQFWTP